jgi:hypothetical protein
MTFSSELILPHSRLSKWRNSHCRFRYRSCQLNSALGYKGNMLCQIVEGNLAIGAVKTGGTERLNPVSRSSTKDNSLRKK